MDGGTEISVWDLIEEMLSNPITDGLTLSGGEPFLQAAGCAQLAEAARNKGYNVWAYTGYTFEELLLRAQAEPAVSELLHLTDILIDGPFNLTERTLSLRWRGSRNQRVVDVQKSLAAGKTVESVT